LTSVNEGAKLQKKYLKNYLKFNKKRLFCIRKAKNTKYMQLSFIDDVPEFNKKYFLDVFAEATLEGKSKKVKLKTINGQQVPENLKVRIPSRFIAKYPEGTIFKLDTKLINKTGYKPYFIAKNGKKVERAIEFFEYNLKLQKVYGNKAV
jgi:hypothetical protein